MSNISIVYDQFLVKLDEIYPAASGWTRIRNAENITDNPITFMRQGYALRIDAQAPAPSEFCSFETIRTFTVIISREIIRTDSQYTQTDDVNKLLLEDVYQIQKRFYNVDRIEIPGSIALLSLAGTTGINELEGGKNNFKFIEVSFDVNIKEAL
jgi:hypothetical protein